MNPQDEQHEALLQKYDLVSKLLTAEPVENEKLKEFRTLFKGDFMAFANGESSLAEEASALDKLRIVESRLEEVVAFPHIFTKTSIAIGGGFSAGKSEFVNSFITQTDIRMPVAIQPATAIPSFVVSAADDSVMGFSRNKGTVDIPRALYNRLTHDFISTFSFNLKDIMPSMTVKVPLRTGLFENICLIDTPGYNPSGGNTDSDKETASDFLRNRDALIWMIGLDATGTIPQSDLEFLHDMELDKLPLYVVLSKADTRPPSALAEILAEVQGTLEDEGIGYVGISAYSSTRREEYLFEGMSLDEFFREQNRHDGRLETILEGEIKGVFKMYRDAIRKDSVESERLKERLDDLSYKVQEMVGDASDEHDELDLTIERIKRAQSDKVAQFKQQIEQAEQIREKVLGAMEAVFRSLGVPRGEEYVDSAERQRQEQVFVEQVGRLPSLDPRIVDEEGKTDLHIAADLNLSVLVLSLLKTSPANLLLLQVKDKKGSTLLHTAAWKNACETAEVLLEYGADLNAKDKNGSTPLHIAAWKNACETAEVLLEYGADLNAKDKNGSTPLHIAAWKNTCETAEVLLQHGAQITARATAVDSNGDKVLDATPLHIVAMVNAHQTAEVLLQHGAQITTRATAVDSNGDKVLDATPLHIAAERDAHQTAEVLLQHGAQVAAKSVIVYGENDNDKVLDATPLRIAAERDAHQTAEVLLQHGAQITTRATAVDSNGDKVLDATPLHIVMTVDAHQTAEVLLQHGADVHEKDNNENTPLHYAAWKNAHQTAEVLLQHGAGVHARNNNGQRPLHYAAERDAHQTAEVLLQHGADVHEKDNNENRPLHYAAMVNAHQTAEVLLQHGAGVHARNNNDDKKTPLHYAATYNALETAKLLLKYGAKVNLKDDGWLLNETPLDYAYQKKADEVVALLRSRGGLKSSEMRENA